MLLLRPGFGGKNVQVPIHHHVDANLMAYTIFQQSGVWVNAPENIDPHNLTPLMQENKVRWVNALIQEGLGRVNENEYVNRKWFNRLGSRVVRLGWVNDTHGAGEDVEAFCDLTHRLVSEYGLQGIVFDLEAAWKAGPELSQAEQAARWQRWQRFLTEWRRLRPGLLTALSTFAYPPYVPFPWQNIAGHKIRFLPQNLYKYAEYYRCQYSVPGAEIVKYPRSYVHFMLSREEGHTLSEGLNDAFSAKQAYPSYKGISAYYAETMTPADWNLMKFAVDSGLSGWNP